MSIMAAGSAVLSALGMGGTAAAGAGAAGAGAAGAGGGFLSGLMGSLPTAAQAGGMIGSMLGDSVMNPTPLPQASIPQANNFPQVNNQNMQQQEKPWDTNDMYYDYIKQLMSGG